MKTMNAVLILFLFLPLWGQDTLSLASSPEADTALLKANDSLKNVYLQCQIEHAKLNRNFSMLKTLSKDFQQKKDSTIQSLSIANDSLVAKQVQQDSLLQIHKKEKLFYKEVALWQWPVGVLLFGLGYSLGSALLP